MSMSQVISWILANPSIDFNLLLGAGGLSLILEKFLTKYQVQSKKVAFILLHLISLVTALLAWALANIPATDAAGVYGSIAIAASFWHRFIISGIYSKDVVPVLNEIANGTIFAPSAAVQTTTASITSATINSTPPVAVAQPLVGGK